VTPPIALASFAAAAIAGSKPIATSMTSWKLAKGLYLVPILFAYSPLITGSWSERFYVFVWACMGLYALCGVLQWRLERPLNLLTASMLLLAAYMLMWSPLGTLYHLAGAGLLLAVILWQLFQRSREQGKQQPLSG
jgi:TRAP-type uncharacterized transport system fused permease subunit